MNKKQKICLWIGIIVFTILGIASYTNGDIKVKDALPFTEIQRALLGLGPGYTDMTEDSNTYLPLLINWTITIVITSGLIYTLKDN